MTLGKRTPLHIWEWICPFCGRQTTRPWTNVWDPICDHLYSHREQLQIKRVKLLRYEAGVGWIEVAGQEEK
jgi:hypothetical protein